MELPEYPSSFSLLPELLRRGSPFRFRNRGRSMSPFLHPGDIITLLPSSRADRNVSVEDIVLFRSKEGRWLLHRVVRVVSVGRFQTKADAALRSDGELKLDQIRGKVNELERSDSGKVYRLDSIRSRRRNRLIAFLSRGEFKIASSSLFCPFLKIPLAHRALRFPKWLLTRLLFR